MKNFIEYFYNIKIDKIFHEKNYYFFAYNGYTYKLYALTREYDVNFLLYMNQKMLNNTLVSEIIINRNNQKISVTPEDFFNYIYRVDKNGKSAYEHDLEAETMESRRDDEILRAYLKFVGGNYSNLVDMAINNEKVTKLKLRAKERNSTSIRINRPKATSQKGVNIDLGYN